METWALRTCLLHHVSIRACTPVMMRSYHMMNVGFCVTSAHALVPEVRHEVSGSRFVAAAARAM